MPLVPISDLWLSIGLSAALVFIASSIIHMVLPYHRTDYQKPPQEDHLMEAMRRFNIPPGDYMMPCPGGSAGLKDPALIDKMNKGPVAVMTIMKTGQWNMGAQLVQWFLFCVVVSIFCAYIAGLALQPGATYLQVSRIVSTVAFIGYALGFWPQKIWYKRKFSTALKTSLDGVIYGFVTGGVFGWLWP